MKIILDPDRPDVLIVRARHSDFGAAIAFGLFGAVATIGGITALATQPIDFIVYWIILLLLGVTCLVLGMMLLFQRTRFSFDRDARTITVEETGLFGTRRETLPLDTMSKIVIVRYWLYNRVARSEDRYWHRVQLHDQKGQLLEFASKLDESSALEAATNLSSFLGLPVAHREGRVEGVVAGR